MNITRDFLLRLVTTLLFSVGLIIYFTLTSRAFHHSSWFVSLTCTFGVILFYLQLILRIAFALLFSPQQQNREHFILLPTPMNNLKAKIVIAIGVPLFGVVGGSAGIGLYIFSEESTLFALLNATLECIIFYSFWFIVMSIIAIFIIRHQTAI